MTCVHTGARVYLEQYRTLVAADAFRVPGVGAVFKYDRSMNDHETPYDSAVHYYVPSVGEGKFDVGDKTLLVLGATQFKVPEAEVDRWIG